MKRLYQALVRQPQDEEGMSMSKNGNKIAVVGRASRVACAAMTVTAAAMLTASTLLAEPLEQTSPDAMIQALQGAFGAHPGFRKNHAKGTCATGSFVGLLEATSYSRSALFSGATIPVVARFSLGGGDPDAPDAGKGPRGMGLEFRLADGSKQHMTMINAPMFLATVPKTFLGNLIAAKPDPATGQPDPAALKAFAEIHPESAGMTKFLADHNPPPSYANSPFFGIHTFKFIDKDNKVTLVKWRFVPEDGEKELTDAELTSMPHDFLEQALIDRVKQGPVKWDMWVTVGEPGDPETNPTVLWPKDRKEFKAGMLTFTSATSQEGAECKSINYDPLVMNDGIAPTDDPVLLFRSHLMPCHS
jgi:catalase